MNQPIASKKQTTVNKVGFLILIFCLGLIFLPYYCWWREKYYIDWSSYTNNATGVINFSDDARTTFERFKLLKGGNRVSEAGSVIDEINGYCASLGTTCTKGAIGEYLKKQHGTQLCPSYNISDLIEVLGVPDRVREWSTYHAIYLCEEYNDEKHGQHKLWIDFIPQSGRVTAVRLVSVSDR